MKDETLARQLDDIVSHLAASSLFRGVSREDLLAIAKEVEPVRAQAGSTIMRQGDAGDCLFVVAAGRLRALRRDGTGDERAVGEIGRGETVGEMSVLTGEPRSATVVAVRDSDLLSLSQVSFDRLAEKHPQTALQMARLIARRLQEAIKAIHRPTIPATITLVGVDSPRKEEFARRLSASLRRFGTVFHARKSEAPDESLSDRWINDIESEHNFVIYECDRERSGWSDRCVRQADRILIVGEADSDPAPSEVERYSVRHQGARAELVLLHGENPPGDTQKWLAARTVASHHHVRLDHDRDIDRIARLLTGRAVGLVLSGGGARGFSQIGIVRAFQERNIPVDVIGGTSIGSVIGALFALGRTPQQVTDLCRRAFVEMKLMVPRSDYTLPLVSIMSGRNAVDGIKFLFNETQIEDLWIKYFCVSNNLTRAEVVVHERGPLARWVRASCSVPGVTPPMFDNGDLLVDGGVLNNLPADVMRSACDGFVAAVDVCERVDLRTTAPYVEELSGWKLLLNRMIPGRTRHHIPSFVSILARTAMLASAYQQEAVKRNVNLYVHPPVDQFSGFAWQEIDRIVEIGYRHGLEIVDRWLAENGRVWEK